MESDFEKPFEIVVKLSFTRKVVVAAESRQDAYRTVLVSLESLDKESRPDKVECVCCKEAK